MTTPEVTIDAPHRKVRVLWALAAALFAASGALLAVRSMPSNMAGEAITLLGQLVAISFSLACLLSAVGLWVRAGSSPVVRAASVATAVFAVWIGVLSPLILGGTSPDGARLVDALMKILLGGAAVGCLLRSNLPSPWRTLPAIVFGVVVAATLIVQFALTDYTAQDLAILSGNLLILVQITASLVLGLVALQLGRARHLGTVVL
ncbi:hypothetical protein AKG07_16705 [Microbacterium sp. CGR1]|uniref:hypothetical protein n=1 Tax=Microbacterium sp. CGR1 TaxID=1696072 RepID=UPI00069F3CA7|nr:hypothetical protein [Microbacterium sp. CGR1]AKV87671.1 hypothetical protein AKG07_16705 [Microbacterium sp. CGR1]